MVLTSLMTTDQALSPKLWPEPFQWSNYVDVFLSGHNLESLSELARTLGG